MIIKPALRSNVFLNAHPLGSQAYVKQLIQEARSFKPFKGPKHVLIIGGSSGYGLSTRIALTFGAKASTLNVSFESGPKGDRTGSAGWWNNIFFQQETAQLSSQHKDFVGDAFSAAMKQQVIQYLKDHKLTIDLVVYSLASGARNNPLTNELVRSAIKPIGQSASGKTIDVGEKKVLDLSLTPANEQEIKDTVYVMGGEDWKAWIDALDQANVLSPSVKTISYTYIGGPTNAAIYRAGTLGKAKEDLELKAKEIHQLLQKKYHGEALISSSKAVVTKASVFIPKMPIYVSCLIDVMTRRGVHETTLAHKYRLFNEMVYGNQRLLDEHGRLRLDAPEMETSIQKETLSLMNKHDNESIFALPGTTMFINEFYRIHGFRVLPDDNIEVDLNQLALLQPK